MSEEIDAVMFDAGGTLIDLSPTKAEVLQRVLHDCGFEARIDRVADLVAKAERKFDTLAAVQDGIDEGGFWQQYDRYVLDELGFTGEVEEFSERLSREFEKVIPLVESWVDYPDARPLLDDLRERRFKLGIISNATDLVENVLKNLHLIEYFDAVTISDRIGVRKPNERIFLVAAEMIKARPNRIIYIGDRLAIDVQGAKRAGMNAILLDRMNIYSDAECLRIKSLNALRRFL